MLGNYDRWFALDESAYRRRKSPLVRAHGRLGGAVRPRFPPRVIETDMFTPITIRRFTGHDKGAIFGAPEKRYDGTTHLRNLFVCGNDQGLVGIIGTILSGISIANRYLLQG